MDCSIPGSSVLHYLPEFAQIHVHWVSDAISPSHPLLPPSPFAFSLSQNQDLFQWAPPQTCLLLLQGFTSCIFLAVKDYDPCITVLVCSLLLTRISLNGRTSLSLQSSQCLFFLNFPQSGCWYMWMVKEICTMLQRPIVTCQGHQRQLFCSSVQTKAWCMLIAG